jgi:hypothetical protein
MTTPDIAEEIFWVVYAVAGVLTGLVFVDRDDNGRTIGSFLAFGILWPMVWTLWLLRTVLGARF